MPQWIHDRAKHLRKKNPSMSESQSFAIATQQSHAVGKSPKGYGTPEGRREANKKYDKPAGAYEKKADPRSKAKTAGRLALLSGFTKEHEVHTKENAMHSKLAGRLPLQAMVAQHIEAAREKLAAADEKDEKGEKSEKKVKKLVEYEKKEHGGKIPSVKEEEAEHEKTASIDFTDPESIEKLATALEDVGEKIAADGIFLGGEHKQGGEQLPVNKTMVSGKQPYKRDAARHQVPNGTGMMATIDNPGAATAIPTDDKRAPGGNGAKYPAKGVLKTAGQSVMEKIEARKAEMFGETKPAEETPAAKPEMAAKTASAVSYVLDKIAEYHGGGETLDDKPAPVPSNAGRELIGSNAAVVAATKKKAFSARKAELAQVLTEPAQSKASDSKVHENLRNADKGGVKIAAAKALLQKIASEGCGCGGSGECRSCRLSKAIEARQASKQ
jgi:hypothetical protein